ncbi:MAG TPA: hypothetical protein VHC22_05285 [Pirellulales bacterium]|nr:hypothetical protein [Pirellulales bacterium]
MRRHFYVTQLSHLFCARVRQEYDAAPSDNGERLSVEEVRSAMNVWLDSADVPPKCRREGFEKEQAKQQYYQRRNTQAPVSHTENATTRAGRDGRRRQDQIVSRPQGQTMIPCKFAPRLTTKNDAKVALSN